MCVSHKSGVPVARLKPLLCVLHCFLKSTNPGHAISFNVRGASTFPTLHIAIQVLHGLAMMSVSSAAQKLDFIERNVFKQYVVG